MRLLGLALMVGVVSLIGCSSINKVAVDEGGGRFHVLKTWSDPSALSASTKGSVMQWCDGSYPEVEGLDGSVRTATTPELHGCVDEPGTLQIAHTPGYLIGVFNGAIWAGGMLGSAELIRGGLKDSGSTTTINGGASASASSSATGGFVPPGLLKK